MIIEIIQIPSVERMSETKGNKYKICMLHERASIKTFSIGVPVVVTSASKSSSKPMPVLSKKLFAANSYETVEGPSQHRVEITDK